MRHVAFRQFVAGTDVHALDMLISEPGAIYVMDRGYIDFARLHTLHQGGAFFVTRAKSNLNAHRVYSAPTDRSRGVIADQTIALDDPRTRQDYPAHLLPRCRKGQDAYLPDQPHGVTGFDHLRPVQKPLAGGTFFQIDQTAPSDQAVLWYLGERREDADMDCRLGLCAGGNRAQTAQAGGASLHIAADNFGV